jgi:hypothetical protein
MRAAIARSGYLFEQSLVPGIERAGYVATPNHRFTIPGETVDHELDIFAISATHVDPAKKHWVFPILLIECKNLEAPIVVFTHDEARSRYSTGMPQLSGLPKTVHLARNSRQSLADFLDCDTWHHYYRGARAGRQFCVVAERKQGQSHVGKALTSQNYVAGHRAGELDLHKALQQLVGAVHAEQLVHARSWVPGKPASEFINVQIYYPILVTAGTLYECFMGSARPRYRRVHRSGLVVSHVRGDAVVDERLDIVDARGLRDLLDVIERDVHRMTARMRRSLDLLETNVHRFAAALVRAGKAKRISLLYG